MITFTFAGDEAGDASFAFSKGASRYFVIAVIATTGPDELRAVLDNIRKDNGLPQTYEEPLVFMPLPLPDCAKGYLRHLGQQILTPGR